FCFRYSGFYQFSVPTLMLKDPELIKQITVKDFDHFTDHRAAIDPELEPLFARNLFTLKGPKWRQMRSTLSGSFTSSKMKNIDEKPLNLKIGDVVWIPIFGFHRDPKHFENPTNFDPERFSDENKRNIKPHTYVPFGAGPRNCIGSRFALLEMKSLFYNLLLNFEIEPTKTTTVPIKLSAKSFNPAPEGGIWLGLKRLTST
uniref:Cytochrome P450 n=1 Tax=Dendroctonus ponderosae TaxID=77166 RepID=A0AAR5P3G8_DENPD